MVLAQDDTASPVPATVALQDIATGQVLGSAVSSQWPVICKTWNPECGLVAWLRHPGVLEVWQLPAGRLVLQEDACAWASARLLADPRREMRALFSADGRYLAVHDRPARRVRVFPFAVSCPPR